MLWKHCRVCSLTILFQQRTFAAPMVGEVVVEEEVLRVARILAEAVAEGPYDGVIR
ncbi:MAG: hypothetical protein QOH93_707, partial [Chloroflexia bacterium]|nr:hypothetical protein [Chloroflexia bacterium]